LPSDSIASEKLVREELCIKFVNTVAGRRRDPVEDRAASPEAMLKWLADADVADRPTMLQIKTRWKRSPGCFSARRKTALKEGTPSRRVLQRHRHDGPLESQSPYDNSHTREEREEGYK